MRIIFRVMGACDMDVRVEEPLEVFPEVIAILKYRYMKLGISSAYTISGTSSSGGGGDDEVQEFHKAVDEALCKLLS